METLRQRLTIPAWDDLLATIEVKFTRFTITTILLLFITLAAQTPTVETQLQAGLAAQAQQEYWRAEAFFQQAESRSPHDFRPPLYLGQLHLLEDKNDLAQSELDAARALANDNADIWLALGDVAQAAGQPDQAERAWLQATHLLPTAAAIHARERLGLLYEDQNRLNTAEAQFAALPTSDALADYHLGALRLERGDQRGARQAFQLTLGQTDPALRAAAQQFLRLLDHWHADAASWQQLGLTYLQNDLPRLAEPPLHQAITLAQSDPLAHAYLAYALLQRSADDQATQEDQRALALEPGNSFANYVDSLLDLQAGQYTPAIHALERALLSDLQNPVLWAERGQIANALHDFPTAEAALRHADEYANGDGQFALLLASFYLSNHLGLDNGSAIAAAIQATRLAPESGLAFDLLGQFQAAAHQLSAAKSALEQAVTLDPTNAAFHLHLAQVQYTLGLLRATQLNIHKAIVLDTQGSIARQAKELLKNLPNQD